MRSLYDDWRAPGLSVCLHEQAGGYAFNKESMHGLADLARAAGARIETGVEVTGFTSDNSGAVTRVHTSAGDIDVEQVVVAVGPWVASLWSMLDLPDRLDVRQPDGQRRHRPADVDLLVPAGGRGRLRPGHLRHQRRRLLAGAPRRLRRAAARRRRHADHRRVLGRVLQARPRDRPGRRPAAHRRPRVHRRPLPHRHRRRRLPGHVVRVAVALPQALRGRPRASTARSARAGSAPSPSTTSRCSTTCAPTCSSPRTPTTATR